MNRSIKISMILLLTFWVLVSLSCALPFGKNPANEEPVSAGETIAMPEPQAQVAHELSSSTLNRLGNLEQDGASVVIPKQAFDSDTTISVSYYAEPPDNIPGIFTPLGVTIAVSITGEQTRFNEPVTIALKFDPALVNGPGDVYVGYYDESYGWQFFVPEEVDMVQGVMRFTTEHFSQYSVVKPKDDLIIDSYVNRRATEQFVRGNNQELTNEQVEKMVRTLMEDGMQIYDNRTIEIITRAVLKEVPGGKIGLAIYDADLEAGVNATLEETVKALGKAIQEGVVSEVAGKPGLIESLSGAAGWAWEREYEEALKVLGSGIIDEIPGVKEAKAIAETAAEVVNHWVDDLWKAPGLEKAYEVYATGQDKYGFRDVEQGNFEDVYNQLGGLADKVRSDYVNGYCKMRGIDPKSLSRDEHLRIGERGLELLRKQWETRYTRREEIERIRANEMALIEMFKEKGLLDMVPGRNPMFSGHEDLEMMLNRLQQMTQRILNDTGRTSFVTHSYDYTDPDIQLWGQDIADLVWVWYSNFREGGQAQAMEAYQEWLIAEGWLASIEEEIEEVSSEFEIIKFSISGEWVWIVDFWECPPAKGTFNFELWNVGADYAEEYGQVNVLSFRGPGYQNNESGCEVIEIDYKEYYDVTFSGGPNGVIKVSAFNEVMNFAQFVDGKKMIFLSFGDSGHHYSSSSEIIVPDPTVFNGLE
jgi:hypothetical protein